MEVDLVVHAKWIVPVVPKGTVLEDHSVAVNDGKIAAIVSTTEAKATIKAKQEVDLTNNHV
jgi:5-methylthioadenosine/S-adenosylhomocysteine deaminase